MTLEEAMSLERPDILVLSIVMISVPERKEQYDALVKKVQAQIDHCKEVHPTIGDAEIIKIITPKTISGGPTIGYKRQMGLERSKAIYVCWLDDDDDVAPNYVETILRSAYNHRDADIITFNSLSVFDDFWCLVRMDLNNLEDEQARPGIINRRPYHVCAFRRKNIEGKAKFPNANIDEDTGFLSKALPLCKRQAHTDAILHRYNRTTKSLAEESYEKMHS